MTGELNTLKITQKKSAIGSTVRQKDTLKALGFKKNNSTVEVVTTPQILGMIEKVRHLISIESK